MLESRVIRKFDLTVDIPAFIGAKVLNDLLRICSDE
jgi:hypothetical protein